VAAIVLAALALAVLLAPPADARTGPVQLGAAINDAGFVYGGAAYRDTFTRNFEAATAESAMKMTAIQPERGVFDFRQADAIVDWARANGKRMHGHTLIWCGDEWSPRWLVETAWTRDELLAVMEQHIRTVMTHFRGRVESWDVVNEALDHNGNRKNCVWQRVIGADWIHAAYRVATATDPGARLFYNEYSADVANPKLEATVALARTLPIHGVGLQHHTYGVAPPQYEVEDTIARFGALGLDVHISELNVTTSQIGGDLALQAQAYWTIAAACQAQPACFRVTTWGFTDAYGWRPSGERAMPFDEHYAPKPAWHALQRALGRVAGPTTAMPGPAVPNVAVTQGGLDLAWPDVPGATYTLEHRDARGTAWRTIASGIPRTWFPLFEREGTWSYRVRAEDGPWSERSAPVTVDRTAPGPPALAPGPAWLRAGGLASLQATDPPLPDGSPGSGVEPTAVRVTDPGVQTVRGTVRDRAGNVSPEGGGEVRVDGLPPQVAVDCPAAMVRGARAFAHWTARDDESGLATPASGAVRVGRRGRARVTARDAAGNTATAGCRAALRSPLRLLTRRALVRGGAARLRIACRRASPRPCRPATVAVRRGARTVGRGRTPRIPRGRSRAIAVRVRAGGRLAVYAGRDRLGVVQTSRSRIQRDAASRRSTG
jgi:endo-1,4-beta-xylanase